MFADILNTFDDVVELRKILLEYQQRREFVFSTTSLVAHAVSQRRIQATEELIKFGCSVNTRVDFECFFSCDLKIFYDVTAIWIAAYLGETELIKLLLSAGAYTSDVSLCGHTLLLATVYSDNIQCFEFLCTRSNYRDVTSRRRNALMIACKYRCFKIIFFLLRLNFPLNDEDECENNALHFLARPEDEETDAYIISHLERAGVAQKRNAFGVTPIAKASKWCYSVMANNICNLTEYDEMANDFINLFGNVLPFLSMGHEFPHEYVCGRLPELFAKYGNSEFQFVSQRPYQHLQQVFAGYNAFESWNEYSHSETSIIIQAIIQFERYFSTASQECVLLLQMLCSREQQYTTELSEALLESIRESAQIPGRAPKLPKILEKLCFFLNHNLSLTQTSLSKAITISVKLAECAVAVFSRVHKKKYEVVEFTLETITTIYTTFPDIAESRIFREAFSYLQTTAFWCHPRVSVVHCLLNREYLVKLYEKLIFLALENVIDINYEDNQLNTILHLLVQQIDVPNKLLKQILACRSIDVDTINLDGFRPIDIAREKHDETVEALLAINPLKCLAASACCKHGIKTSCLPQTLVIFVEKHGERRRPLKRDLI